MLQQAGCTVGIDEVRCTIADHMCSSVWPKQDRSAFFNSDASNRAQLRNRLSIRLIESGQKYEQASHAIAAREMRVGDDLPQDGNVEKTLSAA